MNFIPLISIGCGQTNKKYRHIANAFTLCATLGRHRTAMEKFSNKTFVVSTVAVGLLLVPSFLAAFGEDEGTLPENSLWIAFARLFYILRFPTHTLVWTVFSSGGTIYFLGLILNCLFWGLLIERLSWLLKSKLT